MQGSCTCGRITVRITDPALAANPTANSGICHCHNCKTSSGSAFAYNMWIQPSQVAADGSEHMKCWERTSDSGNHLKRWFCGQCGNLIKVDVLSGKVVDEQSGQPKAIAVIVPMGKFLELPKPMIEGFPHRRCDWLAEIEGAKQMSGP